MESVNNNYLVKHKKFRIDSKKLATVFIISAFIVAIIVFWWLKLVGITVTGEAFCGLDEHTHGDECYISELVCGLDDTVSDALPPETESTDEATSAEDGKEAQKEDAVTEETQAQAETTVEAHTHSEACYSKTLKCKIPEHSHTQDCFPDKTADTETVSDWLSTIENIEITNDIPENLIAIAMTQVGYEESKNNFEYDSDGNKNGYTRYGEWYGNPYGKWNAMFVSFCLHYSNINNSDELKAAGAEAMRLAWHKRGIYLSESDHAAERGDIVFIDNDGDGKADSTGVVTSAGSDNLVVIMGDSNDKVETVNIKNIDSIIGYGLTSELHFAKDMEYKAEISDSTNEPATEPEKKPMYKAPMPMLAADEGPTITYINELDSVIRDVKIETQDGVEITDGSTVYVGQSYVVSIRFSEDNEGSEWVQFRHDDDHHLYYTIPENLHCEPFDWQPIFAQTENGTIEDVGKYKVNDEGRLIVFFEDDESGECFGSRYSNVEFTINFDATISSATSGNVTNVVFNNEINVDIKVDGSAGMNVTKTHGSYDEDNHTMDYTIKVEATHGVVKDLVIDDQIWENHYTLRDTIVVTDLEGNVLDPQPVVSNHPSHNNGADEGFRISGFPDFSAGDGFLINYKTKIYDDMMTNEKVDMWNGLDSNGKDSNGNNIYVWSEDWTRVELEKMEKEGKQSVIYDDNGNAVPIIEWEVEIKKDNHNLQGTVVIDTLGEGLAYYTGKSIRVKHYDEWGNRLPDTYIDWKDVTVNGNTMSFVLPDGYAFDIVYYTTYEDLAEGSEKHYTNSVKATINGKEETAGGGADVIGFIPDINKSASGNDGEYVYFSIEAKIPAVIKDRGNFHLTDLAAFWGYDQNEEGHLYVDNVPENLEITAVTESGQTITFTPYVPGGPTENTYIYVYPAEGNQYHSFNIFFNTSDPTYASSKWILNEDSTLKLTYKLPFDSKTGVNWEGELEGDKTLEDVLLEGYKFANEVYLNYTELIRATASSTYEYSPKITKKSEVNKDGTIDYKVVFNNTIPGSNGNKGYVDGAVDVSWFVDTFDERLEYVPGSLMVTGYSPWQKGLWLAKYKHEGAITGNKINVSSRDLLFYDYNEEADAYGWNGLSRTETFRNYYRWVNAGGQFEFTYKLKVKDEYLYTTETNKYEFDNTAELTWGDNGSSGPVTDTSEFDTGLVDKHVVQENNKLKFDIHVNERALDILKGIDTLTIEDTMTQNLSLYWDSIKLYYEDGIDNWVDFDSEGSKYKYTVTYDQASNKLTFTIPDELHIRIDYTTLITENGMVSVNNSVAISGKAEISDLIDATFKVEDHSGGATASMHEIMLIKQDGETNERLPHVGFHMYGPMPDPDAVIPEGVPQSIITDSGTTIGYIGTYTTGDNGTTLIKTQYLTQGGPYALVEISPPEGYMKLQKPVYFYFYKPDPNGIIQTVTTLIAVENYTYGFALPETGGTGTLPLAIIGISLMAFPVLYSIIRRKRERRFS